MDNVTRLLMQGAAGAAGGGTYVDDVFSSYLYKGTGATQTITNEIDLSGEGGLVWIKNRTLGDAYNFNLYDTERGATKFLVSNANDGEDTSATRLNQFNNNGFRLGGNTVVNASNKNFISWNFRKAPGFFDVVTYTGTGSARTVAHNLGSVPGCIMIKRTDANSDWVVYHRAVGPTEALRLDSSAGAGGGSTRFNDTAPTASVFTVGTTSHVNANGGSYVAYIFAGGESTAATARSVDFNGSSWLDIADHSDFTFGTDDFTIEAWYKADDLNLSNSWDYIFSSGWPVQLAHTVGGSGSRFTFYMADSNSTSSYIVTDLNTGGGSVHPGQWYHVAVTRSGSTFRIFLDGVLKNTATSSGSAPAPNANSAIGRFTPASPYYYADGKISNFRYVKGTAVYTSSFKPPTEPLTAITNTKLLCCNNSSVTGSTVTPGTITNNGSTASTDSPFDDLEVFKFGEEGDQNIIKCGSYVGNGSATGPEVNLGWEPQWLLIKNAEKSENWLIFDSMRGIVTGGNEARLFANLTNTESSPGNFINLTPTGFKINDNGGDLNDPNDTIIYMAIRRPDPLVAKATESGTDVFAMAAGNSSSTIPSYVSGFPVDFAFHREKAASSNWWTGGRLMQGKYLITNNSDAQGSYSGWVFDSNRGFSSDPKNTAWQAWMWKRHAGFDVVTYNIPTASGQKSIKHNLGREPEMIWLKYRDGSDDWLVYNKYLGGGTDPWDYFLALNKNDAQSNAYPNYWGTSSSDMNANYFTINQQFRYTGNHVMMLFASVDGICKVGTYDGSNSTQTITCGFQPRFFFQKRITGAGEWHTCDTVRGWGAGGDKFLYFDGNAAQGTYDFGAPTATGFTLTGGAQTVSEAGEKYIFYAHA